MAKSGQARLLDFWPRTVVGPIAIWEIIRLSRRPNWFFLRAAYLLFLLFLLYTTIPPFTATLDLASGGSTSPIRQYALAGQVFTSTYTTYQIAILLVLTPVYVAPAISWEKEKRTIDELFTSTLSNREIILGKYIARVASIISYILIGMPVVAIAGFIGGIDLEQLFCMTLISISTVLSIAGLSMLVSVYCTKTSNAINTSMSAVLIFLVSPLLVSTVHEAIRYLFGNYLFDTLSLFGDLQQFLTFANPFQHTMTFMMGTSGSTLWADTVTYSIVHSVMALILLAGSMFQLRRVYRYERSVGSEPKRDFIFFGKKSIRKIHAMREDPIFWKEFYVPDRKQTLGYRIGLYIAAAFLAIWLMGLDRASADVVCRFNIAVFTVLTLFLCTNRAIVAIRAEHDKETLISLLGTPLTAKEIIVGKILGSLRPLARFSGLFILPALLWGIYLNTFSIFSLIAFPIVSFGHHLLATSLGVYFSLSSKSVSAATFKTYLAIAMIAGVGHGLIVSLFLPFLFYTGPPNPYFKSFFTFFWCTIPEFSYLLSLVKSPFEEATYWNGFIFETFFGSLASIVGCYLFSLLLRIICIDQFGRHTGRREE